METENSFVPLSKEIPEVLTEIDKFHKEFDFSCVMRPSLKVDKVFQYVLRMLDQKIDESDKQPREERDYTERFFLFESRDTMAILLHMNDNPDVVEEVMKEKEDKKE